MAEGMSRNLRIIAAGAGVVGALGAFEAGKSVGRAEKQEVRKVSADDLAAKEAASAVMDGLVIKTDEKQPKTTAEKAAESMQTPSAARVKSDEAEIKQQIDKSDAESLEEEIEYEEKVRDVKLNEDGVAEFKKVKKEFREKLYKLDKDSQHEWQEVDAAAALKTDVEEKEAMIKLDEEEIKATQAIFDNPEFKR